MKQILLFIFPTVKAVATVLGLLVGMGWGAYGAVSMIAKTEAQTVRDEMKALRQADIQHLDKRFDRIETLIKEGRQ
jgi:hypothetical protein